MTSHRNYYAAQSPRGFSNEVDIYIFRSIAERNAWVSEHTNDGDANSAHRGAYAVSRAEAARIAGPAHDQAGFEIPRSISGTLVVDGTAHQVY